MRIEIDGKSGFCFGVVRAIRLAEQALTEHGRAYSIGDIVHNGPEVARLEARGMKTITHRQIPNLEKDEILFIRAHGEPPSTYAAGKDSGLTIVDATCPVVARLQKTVAEAHRAMSAADGQVVVLGKRGHAEVIGLQGQKAAEGGAPIIVVESIADLEHLDFGKPIYFLSQTTQSLGLFEKIKAEILTRSQDKGNVTINDTICRRVADREPHLKKFAAEHDLIIFVSGRKSSNGRVLFGVCRQTNENSHLVEDETELEKQWFRDIESVGICGATSTPRWIMERVAGKAAIINDN